MSKNSHALEIDHVQQLNIEPIKQLKEAVCIEVMRVYDQAALRKSVISDVVLLPGMDICHPKFTFKKADNFRILEIKILSKTDSIVKCGFRKIDLLIKVGYDIFYSDGFQQLVQPEEVVFDLTLHKIRCPDSKVKHFSSAYKGTCMMAVDEDGLIIEVEAIAQAIGKIICPCTGALILDIGIFFIVRCICIVSLLVPSYGYCPVPFEGQYPIKDDCKVFNCKN